MRANQNGVSPQLGPIKITYVRLQFVALLGLLQWFQLAALSAGHFDWLVRI
jgi:hypothetical protein